MNYGDAKGVTASCVRDCPLGGVARLFPVACRLARLPSRRFLVVPLCAAPLFSCLRALSFGFVTTGVSSSRCPRVPRYLRLFCSCLRYFVVVNGGLCPFIFQGFLFHLVDLLGVFLCVSRMW